MSRFTRSGYEKQSGRWADEATCFGSQESLAHKTVLITGANAGLGRAAADRLARFGCSLILVCRDPGRGELARQEIIDQSGNSRVYLEIADVSLLASVRELAHRLIERNEVIHCLVNNAGVLLNNKEVTSEGFDKSLMTNYVGGYLLTELLMPLMVSAAHQSGEPARVIYVSSGGMYLQSLDQFLSDFGFERLTPWDGSIAYSRTKRAQVCLAEIQAAEHPHRQNVSFFSCHPGWADSPGLQTSLPAFRDRFEQRLRTLDEGADTIVWLAVSPQVSREMSGQFFEDRAIVPKHLWLSGTADGCNDVQHHRLIDLSNQVAHLQDHTDTSSSTSSTLLTTSL